MLRIIGWFFYLVILGPWILWPRAIWRRLYPALKKRDLHRHMWLPCMLFGLWYAMGVFVERSPSSHGMLNIHSRMQALWEGFNAAVAASFPAFMEDGSGFDATSPWPEIILMGSAFCVSLFAAGPLHVLGLVLFPDSGGDKASHGSAFWGGAAAALKAGGLVPKGDVGGLMLGRLCEGVPKKHDPRLRVWRHVLTCAPTGAGKGVGCVVPNLLAYPGSVVCLDVKGENYAVTARARVEMGQAVFCFDPFGITGAPAHCLNWLDGIRLGNEECVSDAASLAQTLVVRGRHGDVDGSGHWDDAAAYLLQGLLLHVAGLGADERHPGALRRLLTLPDTELTAYLQVLSKNADSGAQSAYGMPARSARAFLGKADRERSGVLSTAQRHTAFLDDPRIVRALSATEIDLSALKSRPMSIYIVLPPDKLAAYGRVARACIGLALKAMMRHRGKPQHDVLFLLDEFAQLDHFAAVEDSIAILRGYGGVLWLMVQDLSQLRAVYPRSESFLANTVLQAFGTQDYQTARYLSHMLGSETIEVASHGVSESGPWERRSHGSSQSRSARGRELLTPDEIRRMPANCVLVLEQGQPPHLLQRLDYRADPEWRGQADANPMHERVVRAG